LVFAKVDGPGTDVGVIGWIPSGYVVVPWWRSSERARELLEETAGYMYEVLFNSSRSSNSPVVDASSDSVQHPNSTTEVATGSGSAFDVSRTKIRLYSGR